MNATQALSYAKDDLSITAVKAIYDIYVRKSIAVSFQWFLNDLRVKYSSSVMDFRLNDIAIANPWLIALWVNQNYA